MNPEDTLGPLSTVAYATNGNQASVQERLVRARERAQLRTHKDIAVPGYNYVNEQGDTDLLLRCRRLHYREMRSIVAGNERVREAAQRELYGAADMLVKACEEAVAIVDGEEHPLGFAMGVELANYLGAEGAETPRQAVFMVFADDMDVVAASSELAVWQGPLDDEADSELAKNS